MYSYFLAHDCENERQITGSADGLKREAIGLKFLIVYILKCFAFYSLKLYQEAQLNTAASSLPRKMS